MGVLHINSSARLHHSNTRMIGQYLVDELLACLASEQTSGAA